MRPDLPVQHGPHRGRARVARTVALLVLLLTAVTAGAPTLIRVQWGDTLTALAHEHGTTVRVLQALNKMGGSDTLYAGQTLVVPGQPAPSPAAVRASTPATAVYAVQPGDGLIVLARRFATTPDVLVSLNQLDSTMLLVGQRLRYPVRMATPRPAAPDTGDLVTVATTDRARLAARAMPSRAVVREMILLAARRLGVPADLALALSYQESGFQQRVVSPVDAIGVMQVLPSTARSLGALHGRTFDLYQVSDNVEAGVLLLHDLLTATGDVRMAVAAYYQGLGSISRIGMLPDTKQYVRNVLALRARFR